MNRNGFEKNKKIKIFTFFFIILFLTIFLLLVFINVSHKKHFSFRKEKVIKEALRGSIITKNDYILAYSQNEYRLRIYKRYIDPLKKDLLFSMLHIYLKIPVETIREKYQSNKMLFEHISALKKYELLKLQKDLETKKVFKTPKGEKSYWAFDITKQKEKRFYPLKDTLVPYIGLFGFDDSKKCYCGTYGLEKYYENLLKGSAKKIVGNKAKNGVIIRDKKSYIKEYEPNFDIMTNIDIKLQKNIEKILDKEKERLEAKEIIAAVMESKTGKIISIASSNRVVIPLKKGDDVSLLNISAIQYVYEPGSVLKPIFLSLLIENGKVKDLNKLINTHNGVYFFPNGKRITDAHPYPFLSVEDVIVHSSNIGMSELSKRANPLHIIDGLRKFGFSKCSQIDLGNEKCGKLPEVKDLKNSVIMANISYGYRLNVNFAQLLKAYNVFNNDGKIITPKLAHIKRLCDTEHYELIEPVKVKRVISKKTAKIINNILQEVVDRGTAKGIKIPNIQMGGKTGTAQIVEKNKYVSRYNSSFFGFANDKEHKYTIGVLVIEPSFRYHFASQSAAKVFEKVVKELIKEKYLQIF